jgi:hypothetical protein
MVANQIVSTAVKPLLPCTSSGIAASGEIASTNRHCSSERPRWYAGLLERFTAKNLMKKIIITGGAGFIGSAVVRQFVADTNFTVINVDKLTYAGNLDSLPDLMGHPRHVFEQVDICGAQEIARVFAQHQPDGVMHPAAESHIDRSIDGAAAFIQADNIGGHNERTDLEVVNAICGRLYGLAPRGTGVLRRNLPMSSSARSRKTLCHRRRQPQGRNRQESAGDIREWSAQDRAVVPGQPRLERTGPVWQVPSRAARYVEPNSPVGKYENMRDGIFLAWNDREFAIDRITLIHPRLLENYQTGTAISRAEIFA